MREPENTPKPATPTRDRFRSSIGALAATLGSAIGLGNIWKFPSLAGQNGGATFVLLYLLCVLLVGLPVMIAELTVGRRARANAVHAYERLTPGKPWKLIGVAGVASAFMIMSFYTAVAGWVYAYIAKAAAGSLAVKADALGGIFGATVSGNFWPLFWQWVAIGVVGAVVMRGVSGGIERAIKRLMPALLVLLLVCDIRALSLPGAWTGVSYLFAPDFSKVTIGVVLAALGLAFFKLSIGMGAMTTYGSYMDPSENIPKTALRVALADTAVSLLAGLAIFPAVFAFGFQPNAGASLLFITIPAVFASMPFGRVITVVFFTLTAIAATGAMISLMEVVVAWLGERFRLSRTRATLAAMAAMAVVGLPVNLSNGSLAGIKVFGKNLFDLLDYTTSNIMLPVGGLFIALYVGWVWSYPTLRAALSNHEQLNNSRVSSLMHGLLRYVAPAAIAAIFLSCIGLIKV